MSDIVTAFSRVLEVIQIDLGVVSRDETLHLGRGKHVQPLWVDDAAEAPNESCRLLLNLRVHPEVSHEVDVADPAGFTEKQSAKREHFTFATIRYAIVFFQYDINERTCFRW